MISIIDQMRRMCELIEGAQVRLYVGTDFDPGTSDLSVFVNDNVYVIGVTDDEWQTGTAPEDIAGIVAGMRKERG